MTTGLFDDDGLDEGESLFDDDEPEDEFDEWDSYCVPGSDEVLRLPPFDSREWDREVTTIARAIGEIPTAGPMTLDVWESLCECDGVWFVLRQGDHGTSVDVCGRFDLWHHGVEAVVEASSSYVLDSLGEPLSLLEGDDDDWLDDLSWDPADDDPDLVGLEHEVLDDEDRAIEAMLAERARRHVCGTWGAHVHERHARAAARLERRRELEARAWAERLWATSIVDAVSGAALAGPHADSVLPGAGRWHVIPVDVEGQGQLLRRLEGRRVRVVQGDDGCDAVLVRGLLDGTAARVGAAFGAEVVWALTHDAVQTIHCENPVVLATAVRVI